MTANAIKALFDQGKYQAIVDQLAQWEAEGTFETFTEQDQIKCLYYQSYAVGVGLEQRETALQLVLAARQKYSSPTNRSLLLALMAQQIWCLGGMNRLDEALEVITEGDAILESLTTKERETGTYWIAFFEERKGVYYGFHENNWDAALGSFQRALALREKIGDLYAIALSLHWLGEFYQVKEFNTALDYLQRFLDIAQQLENSPEIAHALSHIGYIYLEKGELDTALDYYQRSLDIAQQLRNSHWTAWILTRIGYTYLCKGELDTALTYTQQALGISEEIGSLNEIIFSLFHLVNIYYLKGDLNTALEYNRRFFSLIEKKENKESLIGCFTFFTWIYYAKGELDTAFDYMQQGLTLYETVGQSWHFPLFISAHIHHARGELDAAVERYQQCLNIWEPTGNVFMIAWFLLPLIRVLLAQKDLFQAQKCLNRLQKLQTRIQNPHIHFSSRLAEALVLKESLRARDKFQAQMILE
ncbi:MAG: tetratricopeptide repeat protein [Candidatus Hodarchaeota archaeon]